MNSSYLQLLHLALPETTVVITAILVLAADVVLRRRDLAVRLQVAAGISALGWGVSAFLLLRENTYVSVMDSMFVMTPLVAHVKIALLALVVVTVVLSA